MGSDVVLKDTFASSVGIAETALRRCLALLRGLCVSFKRFFVVLQDALAVGVHCADSELSSGPALYVNFHLQKDQFELVILLFVSI